MEKLRVDLSQYQSHYCVWVWEPRGYALPGCSPREGGKSSSLPGSLQKGYICVVTFKNEWKEEGDQMASVSLHR